MGKKRANGEGTINWIASRNQWVAELTTSIGTRKTFGAKLKEDALKKRDDYKTLEAKNGIVIGHKYTVKSYLEEYLEISQNSVNFQTLENYKLLAANYIQVKLGKINLRKLSSLHITQAWNQLREDFKKKSPKDAFGNLLNPNTGIPTINHCQAFLSTALNSAVGRRLIESNPCDFATRPKLIKKEIIVLSENDIALLLNHFEDTLPDFFPYVFIAFQTGMRRGELGALQWRDIDLLGMQIHVRRTWGRVQGGYGYKPPKTKNSERSIDLTVGATRFLTELKQKHMEAMEVSEDSHVFRFMYSSPRSRPLGGNITPDNMTKVFKTAVVNVLERYDVHFHNTRHSHAGLLLAMGTHPKVVQERLGHSSIQTTMDIYSALTPNMQRDAIKDFPLLTTSQP